VDRGAFGNYPVVIHTLHGVDAFVFTLALRHYLRGGFTYVLRRSGHSSQQSTESNVTVSNVYKISDLESHRLCGRTWVGRLSKDLLRDSFEEVLAKRSNARRGPRRSLSGVSDYGLSSYLESFDIKGHGLGINSSLCC
jgi:hypothetical protein